MENNNVLQSTMTIWNIFQLKYPKKLVFSTQQPQPEIHFIFIVISRFTEHQIFKLQLTIGSNMVWK